MALPVSPPQAVPHSRWIAPSALSGAGASCEPGMVSATCSGVLDAPTAIHDASSATGTSNVRDPPETELTMRSCPIRTC